MISKVNLQYFNDKQINKFIHKFLKIIRDWKVDKYGVGYIMVIVMNRNVKWKIKRVYKMH